MRYFLLDRITEVVVGKQASGVKCVTLTDEVLHDHFPDHPILPGALVTEALAQLAGYLLEATFNKPDAPVRRAVLAQIEKMKFYNTTGPGERLELKVTIESMLEDAAQVTVEAEAEGERKAKGRLTFAMMKVESKAVAEQRRYLYNIWTRKLENPPEVR